jgi:hypothetical protein
MYTIFFTINCVEQLIFSKTFVDHLQFEQLIFFCLKVKLLESSWSPKINWIRAVDKKNNYCSNGVEQMKKHVEQIFQANEFRADDHDPLHQFHDFSSYYFITSFWFWVNQEKVFKNKDDLQWWCFVKWF